MDFNGKRYVPYTDDYRNKSSEYGVYDNVLKQKVYSCTNMESLSEARDKAIEMNNKKLEVDFDYKTATHFKPLSKITSNVRCLNGSAHVKTTTHIEDVTCALCLDAKTHQDYWIEKGNQVKGI